MTFAEKMHKKAKSLKKRLVLPEGNEPRIIKAARLIIDQKIAIEVSLLGEINKIKETAKKENINLTGINLIDPKESKILDSYAEEYYELRKHKGTKLQEAREIITDNLKWGAMMVRKGDADAMVAGAENSTGKVLVAAFTIIKTAPRIKYASSCFVMSMKDKKWGIDGNLIFSDCATIPDPDAEQLAEITISSANSCRSLLLEEPKVAMLSFSTKGSAKHPNVDKVTEAFKIVKDRDPKLQVDGELQADAALIEAVGQKKAPKSEIAGKANVLIFPDLQSGNIGYKLVERLAGAEAYGPILQGFAKPVSDLSRGCSIDDIVTTSAITLAQA